MIASDSSLPRSARSAARILRAWTHRDAARLESRLRQVQQSACGGESALEAERLELLEGIAREMCRPGGTERNLTPAGAVHLRLLAHLAGNRGLHAPLTSSRNILR